MQKGKAMRAGGEEEVQSRNIRTKFNLDKYCKAQTCPHSHSPPPVSLRSCLFLASPRSLIILAEFSAYLQTPLKQRLYTHVSASVCVWVCVWEWVWLCVCGWVLFKCSLSSPTLFASSGKGNCLSEREVDTAEKNLREGDGQRGEWEGEGGLVIAHNTNF